MTIDRLAELYERGLLNPINGYLVLLTMLDEGTDPDRVLASVPKPLLPRILKMARDHYASAACRPESGEARCPKLILDWDDAHREGRDHLSDPEATVPAALIVPRPLSGSESAPPWPETV